MIGFLSGTTGSGKKSSEIPPMGNGLRSDGHQWTTAYVSPMETLSEHKKISTKHTSMCVAPQAGNSRVTAAWPPYVIRYEKFGDLLVFKADYHPVVRRMGIKARYDALVSQLRKYLGTSFLSDARFIIAYPKRTCAFMQFYRYNNLP